jgi:hypothetical protein
MYYHQLNTVSQARKNILNYVESNDKWFFNTGFDILKIPNDLLDTNLLSLKTALNGNVVVLKMVPRTFYRFHTDTSRYCAVNLLLTGFDSNCYFGDQTADEEVIENVTELQYDPDRYYLLNTRKKHAVRNGNEIRYMLSMGFNDHKYEIVKKWCEDHKV